MLTRRRLIALSASSTLAPIFFARAQSSAWPNRSVRLIVPLAAGGPTDTLARVLADRLSKLWNQQVVILNQMTKIVVPLTAIQISRLTHDDPLWKELGNNDAMSVATGSVMSPPPAPK